MDRTSFRRPKEYFTTEPDPSHVTFDDGHGLRRSLPWGGFTEARWNYGREQRIMVVIAEWVVELHGQNLDALFDAVEDKTLKRVVAQPDLAQRRDCDADCVVTRIEFVQVTRRNRNDQGELPPQLDFEIG